MISLRWALLIPCMFPIWKRVSATSAHELVQPVSHATVRRIVSGTVHSAAGGGIQSSTRYTNSVTPPQCAFCLNIASYI